MQDGFVLLHRKIIEEAWASKPDTLSLAIYLMMMANHKEKKIIFNNEEIVINRGQLITGRKKLSEKTGLSQQNVRTSLKILVNSQFLTIKVTNKFSIITICKYDYYQDIGNFINQQPNQQVTNKQPTSNQQVTTNKECKELKECKRNIITSEDKKTSSLAKIDFQINKDFPPVKMKQSEYDNLPSKLKTHNRNYWIMQAQRYWYGRKHKLTDVYLAILNWDRREFKDYGDNYIGCHQNTGAQKERAGNNGQTKTGTIRASPLSFDEQLKQDLEKMKRLGISEEGLREYEEKQRRGNSLK